MSDMAWWRRTAASTFPTSWHASGSGFEPQREHIFNQQEELQRKLDEINREFAAIEAYESAKTGKAARSASVSAGAASNAFAAAAGVRSC